MPLLAALLYYGFFGFGALLGLSEIFEAGARSDPSWVIMGVASLIGGAYMVTAGRRAQVRGRRPIEAG
jgi:hypothetical protein